MHRTDKIMATLILFWPLLLIPLAKGDAINTGSNRVLENPISNGDLKLRVNIGGTKTDALKILGSSGEVDLTNNAGISLSLTKTSNNAPAMLFNSSSGNAFSIQAGVGGFNLYNDGAASVIGSTNQSGAWTFGASGGAQTHAANGTLQTNTNDTSTTAPGLIIHGTSTSGNDAMLQWSDTASFDGGKTRAGILGTAQSVNNGLMQFYTLNSNTLTSQGQISAGGAWTLGPSSSTQTNVVNGTIKQNTTTTANFTVQAGTGGATVFTYSVSTSVSQTCSTTCNGTRPTAANANSGACLMAWTSGGVPQACSVTAANQFCMCAAIP